MCVFFCGGPRLCVDLQRRGPESSAAGFLSKITSLSIEAKADEDREREQKRVLRQSHPCPRSFLARATGRVSSQMSIKQEFHSCPNQNSFGNASSKSSLVQIEPRLRPATR